MPLPYIVLDQNVLRCADTISSAMNRCRSENLQLLIPDGAGFEFSKGSDPYLNWQRSLKLIMPYDDLIVVGRKISHIWNEEISTGIPCITIVDHGATTRFRNLLQQLNVGKVDELRQIFDGMGWQSMIATLDRWSHHEERKSQIKKFYDAIRPTLPEAFLKDLRRNPDEAISQWLESTAGVRLIFQGIQARGISSEAALSLAISASALGALISGLAALSLHWIAVGGFETAKPQIITNDIIDLEYGIMGALSDSLLSSDRRLKAIHQAIKSGIDGRANWFSRAITLGPNEAG